MNHEVMITCAITGDDTKVTKSPHCPVTPEQIAAAAVEAARAGAAMVHIHVRDPESGAFSMETRHAPLWDTALKFGPPILRKVLDAGVPKNTVINVNFPSCMPDDVAGVRVTRQGKRNLGFLKIDQRRDGRGNPYFWIGFERLAKVDVPAEGTDLWALASRFVSVTPLHLDRTDEAFSAALTSTLK